MTVSLCIIANNEEKTLPGLLTQVLEQTYPKELTQIVLVDSASEDGTKDLMAGFKNKHEAGYLSVLVLDNPKKSQAAGWNTAISEAAGDIIIRLDAHAEIPEDFIQANVSLIESGEDVCGGARPNRIDSPTPMKEMLFLAESSLFGSSPAGYRRKQKEKKYVSSVFHGAYRRRVFEKVGGFNEDLGRTEDNELHYRIRKAGYRICQGSDIISYQHIRGSLSSMMDQKYANGKWIGLTMGVCYQCISSFHFVPFYFVLTLLCSALLFVSSFITGNRWMAYPMLVILGAYFIAAILMSIAAVIRAEKKHPLQFLLPVVFFLLHFAYGTGTIVGLVRLPFWKHKLKKRDKKSGASAMDRIEAVRQSVIKNSVQGTGKGADTDPDDNSDGTVTPSEDDKSESDTTAADDKSEADVISSDDNTGADAPSKDDNADDTHAADDRSGAGSPSGKPS